VDDVEDAPEPLEEAPLVEDDEVQKIGQYLRYLCRIEVQINNVIFIGS